MNVKFGPAGNSDIFYNEGHKSSLEMPLWLKSFGLDAYEYQCGRGVKISPDACETLRDEAEKNGILLSVHSPYYINLATEEEEKKQKGIDYILSTAKAAKQMGADRIVVHMGSAGKITRARGVELSKELVLRALSEMKKEGLSSVTLCLETMGKLNQLGTPEETADVCSIDDSLLPCVDFGHVNAREQGSLTSPEEFLRVVKIFEKKLGAERADKMHVHFSKIEYTHMGEKKHLTFDDFVFGPEFSDFAEIICRRGMTPRIICESAGTQAEDALAMKKIMEAKLS